MSAMRSLMKSCCKRGQKFMNRHAAKTRCAGQDKHAIGASSTPSPSTQTRLKLRSPKPPNRLLDSIPSCDNWLNSFRYRESEIVELMAAARQIGPEASLRPAVMETLFGLVACTGLRISEALGLLDADVDVPPHAHQHHLDRLVKPLENLAQRSTHLLWGFGHRLRVAASACCNRTHSPC